MWSILLQQIYFSNFLKNTVCCLCGCGCFLLQITQFSQAMHAKQQLYIFCASLNVCTGNCCSFCTFWNRGRDSEEQLWTSFYVFLLFFAQIIFRLAVVSNNFDIQKKCCGRKFPNFSVCHFPEFLILFGGKLQFLQFPEVGSRETAVDANFLIFLEEREFSLKQLLQHQLSDKSLIKCTFQVVHFVDDFLEKSCSRLD